MIRDGKERALRTRLVGLISLLLIIFSIVVIAPDVSHTGDQILPSTFRSGNFTFNDSLTILDSLVVNASTLVVNSATQRVGIGTTGPATKLEIVGSSYPLRISNLSGEPGLQIENTETSGRRYDIFVGSTGTYGAGTTYRGTFFIYDRTATSDRLVIDTSGRVGINDSTPDYGLDVGSDVNSDDCFREAGTQVAGTCASDIRLKQNVTLLNGSLGKILKLKPVEFEWKPGIDNLGGTIRYVEGRQVGLVAQDVEKVLPHLVHEKDGYLSVEYNLEMQMMLIQAIQEQQKMIERQQAEINQLKSLVYLDH